MALSVDSAATAVNSSTSSSALATGAITTQATGSGLIIDVSWFQTVANFTSVEDSKSNIWVQVGSFATTSFSNMRSGRFYCANATGGSSHTFTLNLSGATVCTIWVQEVKTTNGNGITLDQVATVTEDSASPFTSQSITTTVADEILVAFHGDDPSSGTQTHTVGNSFVLTQEETAGDTKWTGWVGYRVVTATGTYNTTNTQTGTINSVLPFLASFSEAASTAATKPMFRGS